MTKRAAAIMGFLVNPTMARGVGQILIVPALPVCRVGTGSGMTGGTTADNAPPAVIEVIHDQKVRNKSAIDNICRTTVTIQTGKHVIPCVRTMYVRVGERYAPVRCRNGVNGLRVAASI